MPTKRELKCLQSIPSAVVRVAWRKLQENKAAWASVVQKLSGPARNGGLETGRWGPLFDIPDRLGRDTMHRLGDLYFAYLRVWEDILWRTAFGEWAGDLEDDISRIRTGYIVNPRAGFREMSDEALRLHIWEKDILPQLRKYDPEFVFEFAWAGPPMSVRIIVDKTTGQERDLSEAEIISEERFDASPGEYWRRVFEAVVEAGIPREGAARMTRQIITSQGIDLLDQEAKRTWDDLERESE